MKRQLIAVVGTGYWRKNLVRNFYSLETPHTICDINAVTVKELCSQYPGTSGTSTFSNVLSNPDITSIAIATPAEPHFKLARKAMLAGKDV